MLALVDFTVPTTEAMIQYLRGRLGESADHPPGIAIETSIAAFAQLCFVILLL